MINSNSKIIMGMSDATTYLTFGNQLGFVTFYGSLVMTSLATWKNVDPRFRHHVLEFLFESKDSYIYSAYQYYNDGYPDWSIPENAGQLNPLKPNPGWQWLQGDGVAEGTLWGGNIEVLEFIKGTVYWPPQDFWEGKILFLETSEGKPTPTQVRWMLRNYGTQAILDVISGLLVGRPLFYSEEESKTLDRNIKAVVGREFGRPDLPVVTFMDFGHTDPIFILPYGVKACVDCRSQTFMLVEKWLE